MRDPNRLDEFYKELCRVHRTYFSDWPFGQFMMNFLGNVASTVRDPFFPEENEMLKLLYKYACLLQMTRAINSTQYKNTENQGYNYVLEVYKPA